jgi:hypothetical protein
LFGGPSLHPVCGIVLQHNLASRFVRTTISATSLENMIKHALQTDESERTFTLGLKISAFNSTCNLKI